MISKNKGFGLIELLISILVASIIVVGLYSLLTSSIVNYGFSNATNKATKNAHQINNIFDTLIFQTGYLGYSKLKIQKVFDARSSALGKGLYESDNWKEGEVVKGSINNDRFKIRFIGASLGDDFDVISAGATAKTANGNIFDCRGVPVPNTVEIELEFFVYKDSSNEKRLVCQENVLNNEEPGASGSEFNGLDSDTKYYINENVRAMALAFGVNKGTDSGYYTADQINTISGIAWNNVGSIKYGLVTSIPSGQKVRSAQTTQITVMSKEEFALTETTDFNYSIDSNDKNNVHRIVKGSISLLNVNED